MFNEKPIITPQEFKGIANVSDAFDSAKQFDAHVLNAQRLDVAPRIGTALFLQAAAIEETRPAAPTTEQQALIDLLDGAQYSVNGCDGVHYGLKRAVAYYALARFYQSGGYNATPTGVRQAVAEFSERPNAALTGQQAQEFKNMASEYLDLTLKFLQAKSDVLTNFKQSEAYQGQDGGGRVFVSGGRLRGPKYSDQTRYDYD